MSRHTDMQVLVEQALRHVLSEQHKLLKRDDCGELVKVIATLNDLALSTEKLLADGVYRVKSTSHLTKQARELEKYTDDLSVELWKPILISVSAIYERIEESLQSPAGRQGSITDLRAFYHNLRLRLLEQMLGARMLVSNSDLGDEVERIWQQFLQKHLGDNYRVLRGGHIYDHAGNHSDQIDLVVVPSEAQVFVPGDSEGGKVQVLIDNVISAIMVTSTLTVQKLKNDWRKLQTIPPFGDLEKDFPNLKGHPWPLCFIVGAQSDPTEELEKAWCEVCQEGLTKFVPQFVISLDSGFLYSGITKWPRPDYPGNYVAVDHVHAETGIYSGLGLAWLITQHQGRLAVIRHQTLGPVTRFSKLLHTATQRSALPPTYSSRFETMFQMGEIAGVMSWGNFASFANNRLQFRSLSRRQQVDPTRYENLYQDGIGAKKLGRTFDSEGMRWFRYGAFSIQVNLLAVEEWLQSDSKADHKKRIAVFNVDTGDELTGPEISKLGKVDDVRLLIESPIPR